MRTAIELWYLKVYADMNELHGPQKYSTRKPGVTAAFYNNSGCSQCRVLFVLVAISLFGCDSSSPQMAACPGEIVGDVSLNPSIMIVTTSQNGDREISGIANNLDARVHRVVLWAKTDQWYIQPYIDTPFTSVCEFGSWKNNTHPWERMVALLVDQTYIPNATLETHPSGTPGVLAWDEYPQASPDRTIEFSDYNWRVKSALTTRVGPGPNYFSDSEQNVRVDDQGLHLTTAKRENKWFSSEVVLLESLGYGSYTFRLSSRVDNLDTRAIFAGFVYESLSREIDIEFSQQLASPNNAQYVVQPWMTPGNLVRYDAPSTNETSHRFVWGPTDIQFVSWIGHDQEPPNTASVIQEWTYAGPDVPPPGGERMRFNLWLFEGLEPVDDSTDEVIIEAFTFVGDSS